jgi:Clostridial hydrophobic W
VIIESPAELDVVAVYGTAEDAKEPVTVGAFYTERVEPRCLPVCDDFDLDISTGVADWYVKGPGAGATFSQATLTQPLGSWAAPPAGSLWIKPGTLQSDGDYTYRLAFKLCSGFRKSGLNLSLLADYYANVFLNGHQIPPVQTAGPNFSTPISFATNSHFKAGQNELTVVVHNSEQSPTGLALHGGIEVQNGLCPGAPMPLLVCPEICYEAYTRHFFFQQDGGWWSGLACNGAVAGTIGQHRRMQAFRCYLTGTIAPGTTIEYQAHMQGSGTTPWIPEGQICGITNQPKRMEALAIRFVIAPLCCSIGYQVHMRKDIFSGTGGWGNWAYDGQMAGTTGQNRRIEAFKAEIHCG